VFPRSGQVAERASEKAGGWLNKLSRGLSAPLLITVVGAILAGYLIPRITSQVEDHRKAREIQTALVEEMSEAVAPVIGTGQLLATRTIQKAALNTTRVFNDTLIEWETSRASIAARLRSYFANASIGEKSLPGAWEDYTSAVDNLYFLSTTQRKDRCQRTAALETYLNAGDPELSCPLRVFETKDEPRACAAATDPWKILALCDEDTLKPKGKGYQRGENFFDAYRLKSTQLLEREGVLLDAVRTTTPAGF
jgi:hypothetical protein